MSFLGANGKEINDDLISVRVSKVGKLGTFISLQTFNNPIFFFVATTRMAHCKPLNRPNTHYASYSGAVETYPVVCGENQKQTLPGQKPNPTFKHKGSVSLFHRPLKIIHTIQ